MCANNTRYVEALHFDIIEGAWKSYAAYADSVAGGNYIAETHQQTGNITDAAVLLKHRAFCVRARALLTATESQRLTTLTWR